MAAVTVEVDMAVVVRAVAERVEEVRAVAATSGGVDGGGGVPIGLLIKQRSTISTQA